MISDRKASDRGHEDLRGGGGGGSSGRGMVGHRREYEYTKKELHVGGTASS
jgi:hypothetical protein